MNRSSSSPRDLTVGTFDLTPDRGIFIIAGPCVIESEQCAMEVGREVARIHKSSGIPIVFKSSFDKANRTSVDSFRGPGLVQGLEILARIRDETGLPVISDIHHPEQASAAGKVLDVIQIPAFLSRQTDLLVAAGQTGKPVNIKKGQFLSPDDIEHAIRKVLTTGNDNIMITERGSAFGYQDLIVDMRSIVRLRGFGHPVVFDATHSAQLPGRGNGCSGGDRSLVAPLARAAVAAGADGVFLEVHPDPENALCDGPNSLALKDLEELVLNLREIYSVVPRTKIAVEMGSTRDPAASSEILTLNEKLKKIRLLIFDVDGALTDGKITLGGSDLEIKSFHVRDGHGIKLAKRTGLEMALITGRTSEVVPRRAMEVGIERVYQGIKDKKPVLAELMKELDLQPEQVAMLGDDVVDIPVFRRIGLGVAVPEAPAEVRNSAVFVTQRCGGDGAARELVEMILKAQDTWAGVMARYYV
jgi:2-dehydro-3-deoxyphosphooctonate aldolase (KDO 8-P synthase)